MLAAQAVAWGDSENVVAGGQESMSLAPHVLPNSRDGQRMGDWKLVDRLVRLAQEPCGQADRSAQGLWQRHQIQGDRARAWSLRQAKSLIRKSTDFYRCENH